MRGNRKLVVFYWTMAMIQMTFIVALFGGVSFDQTTVMAVVGAHTANAMFFVGGNAAEHMSQKGQKVPVMGEVK